MQHRTKEAAAIVQISPTSLRNWCATFAAFLSPGANPEPGIERLFSDHDLAILQRVKELRAQHLTYEAITSTLHSEDTESLQPYIELHPSTPEPETTPTPTLTPTPNALPAEYAIQIVAELNQRFTVLHTEIETMKKDNASRFTHAAFGFIAGVFVCVFVLLVLWLVGRV